MKIFPWLWRLFFLEICIFSTVLAVSKTFWENANKLKIGGSWGLPNKHQLSGCPPLKLSDFGYQNPIILFNSEKNNSYSLNRPPNTNLIDVQWLILKLNSIGKWYATLKSKMGHFEAFFLIQIFFKHLPIFLDPSCVIHGWNAVKV